MTARTETPSLLRDAYRAAQPELSSKREPFMIERNGRTQIDLQHQAIQTVRTYGNEVLNSTRIGKDGRQYGLRVRASERNAGSPEMIAMGEMPLDALVAYTKTNRKQFLADESLTSLLPKDFATATAGNDQWGKTLFYHDAPLLVEGILDSDIPDKIDYAKGMVENFVYLVYLLGYIPNGSSLQIITRSQPPSLTRMAWRVFDAMQEQTTTQKQQEENVQWFTTVMEAAEYEFHNYWKNKTKYNHHVEGSTLITPGDLDIGAHDPAERETGRDMTMEYYGRAHDFQEPVLNGNLVGYAWDIAVFKRMLGHTDEADRWQTLGDTMAEEMSMVMFDGTNYQGFDARRTRRQSRVASLSGYMPLAHDIPSHEEVQAMVANIDRFRGPFGLSHIVPETMPVMPPEEVLQAFGPMRQTVEDLYGPRQWGDGKENIPEWPIETHGVIKGLTKYGYYDEAISLAEDWLLGYTEYYREHGTLPEKRNVITGKNGNGVEYGQQIDFGWSIANYLWLLKKLPDLYALREKRRIPRQHVLYDAS